MTQQKSQGLSIVFSCTQERRQQPIICQQSMSYLSVSVGLLRITELDSRFISWPRGDSSMLVDVAGSSADDGGRDAEVETLVDTRWTPLPLRVSLIWSKRMRTSQNDCTEGEVDDWCFGDLLFPSGELSLSLFC